MLPPLHLVVDPLTKIVASLQCLRPSLLRFLVALGVRQVVVVPVRPLLLLLEGGVQRALLFLLVVGLLLQYRVFVADRGVVRHLHVAIAPPLDKLVREQQLLLPPRKELRWALLPGVLFRVPLHPLLEALPLDLLVPYVVRVPFPVVRPPLPLGFARVLSRRHRDEL